MVTFSVWLEQRQPNLQQMKIELNQYMNSGQTPLEVRQEIKTALDSGNDNSIKAMWVALKYSNKNQGYNNNMGMGIIPQPRNAMSGGKYGVNHQPITGWNPGKLGNV